MKVDLSGTSASQEIEGIFGPQGNANEDEVTSD